MPTKSSIQRTVEEILLSAGVQSPPVPVEEIAARHGAEIRFEPFEGDLSGLLFREQGRAIIGVNSWHAEVRQRFTIAHELGHLLLHQRGELHVDRDFRVHKRDDRSSQAIDSFEITANAFAAELLMPTGLVREELGGQVIDFDDDDRIRELAHTFKVSVQATVFRLTNLRLLSQPLQLEDAGRAR